MVRILKAVKDRKDEILSPRQRGARYWIDQASELQAEGGGDAHK